MMMTLVQIDVNGFQSLLGRFWRHTLLKNVWFDALVVRLGSTTILYNYCRPYHDPSRGAPLSATGGLATSPALSPTA
jgi:hypothetical protein